MPSAPATNDHIREFLAYYVTLPHSPHYAVMLNGPWGVGKTYLVKEFLKENAEQAGKCVYVSLYGLTSIEEIDSAVLQAVFPAIGWKVTKIGARIGATVLKHFGVNADDLKVSDLMSRFKANLFIFDDLERCDAPINKSLGYINEFVEHAGCKVIILANEAEIKGAEYHSRREKLIGKTLEVQSAFDEAFRYFISLINHHNAKVLFEKHRESIASIYTQSGLNNLRILQQTMWDFERFSLALKPAHRKNDEAMIASLKLLFALSFELRSGRISANDLNGRMNKLVLASSRRKDEAASSFSIAGNRYPDVNLNDTILSDRVLIDFLIKGIVDNDDIRSCLDISRFFISTAGEPAWQTVWHWFERSDEQFAAAYQKMENQFADREFVISGEILHVLGLQLFLARVGLFKKSPDVIWGGKRYIDDVYAGGRLEPLELDDFQELRSGGYGGLGIHDHDTAEYLELFQYLQQRRQRVSIDRYPERAARLFDEMEIDPESSRQLSPVPGGGSLSRIPLLPAIDPGKFVAFVLKQEPAKQHTILKALYFRYEHGTLTRELAPEMAWIVKVREKLIQKAKALSPIGRYRLQENVKANIDAVLPQAKSKKDPSRSAK